MKKRKRRYGHRAGQGICILWAVLMLVSCGSGSKLVFTKGSEREEVFRIGSSICTVPEMMVYLANIRNQYEKVYGSQVWSISHDGVTLEENVKKTVLEKLAQTKAMYLLAQSRGIALDEEESRCAGDAAEEYFASLNETETALFGVDEDILIQMYREYALADKVYRDIIRDVNPEISDDEARTITVQHILLRTCTIDEDGTKTEYSDEARRTVYEKACEIYRMAADGEHEFADLAARYSEDSELTLSFGKGEKDIAFEEAAFALETGQVSQVTETEEGYRIIKCISTFDKGQTDINKQEIVEQRRREVFGQEYDAFVGTLARQLNEEVWDEIALPKDERVTTSEFFDIYEKHFPNTL